MVKYFIVCFSLAIILRSIIGTEATQGIDVSQPASTEIFSCLKQTGYDFAIVRAFRSSGMPDYNAPQTIRNARQANFATVEAYMFPCPKCGNAQKQVDDMLSLNLDADWIWLDIEIYNWYDDVTKNQKFFQELINADFGKYEIGIYTSKNNWSTIMGLDYTEGSQYPLWYAHYDKQPNFSDFQPFGGWSEPLQKQFSGDQTVCGFGVDLNYREQSMAF